MMSSAYLANEKTHARSEMPERFAAENGKTRRSTGKIATAAILSLLLGTVFLILPPRVLASSSPAAQISIGVAVRFGPPPLPVYQQPICPGPGYIWTPGYWAWDPNFGYYWVPGTWVLAPFVGALWTPGYWGWNSVGAVFIWHSGYWGTRVGFYGGINYGFGYTGYGYHGGYWRGRRFYYNRAVNRISRNIRHVYRRSVVVRNVGRVSYNGGRGGIMARPTRDDRFAERERRMGPIRGQLNQERMARGMPRMRWSENHGRPDIAATPRPERFRDRNTSRATRSGGVYRPERTRRVEPRRSNQPRRFERQPRQQQRQPSYRRQPERRYQPSPKRNQRPTRRNEGRPQYRGQQGRQQQPQTQRGRGKQQNRREKSNQKSKQGERGKGGPPPRN